METPKDMQSLREAIEAVDREILLALRRRMDLVEQLVAVKLEAAVPLRDRLREEQVLDRVRHLAVETGLDARQTERLYRLIMEMSVARQQGHLQSLATAPLRVGYQGVEGSYSHLTAQRRYAGRKGGVFLAGYESFGAVVEAVKDGSVDFALLPIENTTSGSINETYDLLAEGGVTIVAEVVSHIEHCLLALPGTKREDLRTVLSHPQGLLQCQDFLRTLPDVRAVAEFDTAAAARKVREGHDRTVGAIASESAAGVFGLEVLARGIQSQAGNFTRFVEIATEPAICPPDVPCKTSLELVLGDQPGALGKILHAFSTRRVNLTKLESRPILGKPWQYRFYLDVDGHADAAPVAAALEEAGPLCLELRVLGTYPTAGHDARPEGASG